MVEQGFVGVNPTEKSSSVAAEVFKWHPARLPWRLQRARQSWCSALMPALAASKQVHYRVEQECHDAGMRPRILHELRVHRHCGLNADSAFFRRYR